MYDNNTYYQSQESFYTNKRISDLTDELHNKERLIMSLNKQITSLEPNKFQIENLKRQISNYEEKLKEVEKESQANSQFYEEQLRQISDSENKLRSNLISKDKIIHDYNNIIKDNESLLCSLRRQLVEKDSLISSLRQDIGEQNAKIKNLTNKVISKEEELKKMKEKTDIKIGELSEEKNYLHQNLNELKIIASKQNQEINDLNQNILFFENELNMNKNLNAKNQLNISELTSINNEYKHQFDILNDIKIKYQDNLKVLESLKFEYEAEIQKNENLSRSLNDITEKYNIIKEKYSGENTLENFKSVSDTYQNEIQNLKETVDSLKKINGFHEAKLKDMEKESNDIILSLNSEFKNITEWIETYLGVFFENDMDLINLPVTINKSLKTKFKLDSLKDSLSSCRKKINEEFNKIEINNQTLRYEIEENIKNQQNLISEISSLKQELLNRDDNITLLKNQQEELKRQISLMKDEQRENYYSKAERATEINRKLELIESCVDEFLQKQARDSRILTRLNQRSEIEDKINLLIDYCQKYVLEQNNDLNSSKESFSPKRVSQDPNLSQTIKSLRFENEMLKKKVDTLEVYSKTFRNDKRSDTQSIEAEGNSRENSSQMERRIHNLLREIELKDIQIKSQEQMINRRNKELEDYRSRLNITSGSRSVSRGNISQNNYYTNTLDNEVQKESFGKEGGFRTLSNTENNNLNRNQVMDSSKLSQNKNEMWREHGYSDKPSFQAENKFEISENNNVNDMVNDSREGLNNEIKGLRSKIKKQLK